MRLHRLRYELPAGAMAADPRPVPFDVLGEPPQELVDRIGAYLPAAVSRTDVPGAPGTLSHTRLPGGATLLCRTETAEAGEESAREPSDAPGTQVPAPAGERVVRRVTAWYLPGGGRDLGDSTPVETWFSPWWEPDWKGEGGPGRPEWCDDERLVEFAAGQGDRVEPFLADVRGLFASPAGRQIVIAAREPVEVARWIALACASLPVDTARALTFATAADAPASTPHQILGIGPDSGFDRHDPTALEHLYRVHDGLGGPGSPPPPYPDPWARAAAQAWRQGIAPRTLLDHRYAAARPFDLGPLRSALPPRGPGLPGTGGWAAAPETAYDPDRTLVSGSGHPGDATDLPGSAMTGLPASMTTRPGEPAPPAPADAPTAWEEAPTVVADLSGARTGVRTGARPAARPWYADPPGRGSERPLSAYEVTHLLDWLGTSVPAGGESRLASALAGLAAGEDGDDRGPVRERAVERLCTAVNDLQSEPPAEWAALLEVLHALSPPVDRHGEEARYRTRTRRDEFDVKVAARLSRSVLARPDRRDDPATRALLTRLPAAFTRLVLEQIEKSEGQDPPDRLMELAASPLADWLAAVEDLAPTRLRLVVLARRLGAEGRTGLPVFHRLAEVVSADEARDPADGEEDDPAPARLYKLCARLAWPGAGPTLDEAAALIGGFGPFLGSFGLDRALVPLLEVRDGVTEELVDLASALLDMGTVMDARRKRIADVLDLGRRLATGAAGPAAAAGWMDHHIAPGAITEGLRSWFDERLALALADGPAADLVDALVLKRLRHYSHDDLLWHFVTAQTATDRRKRLVDALLAAPEAGPGASPPTAPAPASGRVPTPALDTAARLFAAWNDQSASYSSEWDRLAPRFVHEVFEDVVKRLSRPGREQVGWILHERFGGTWADLWWRFVQRMPDPRTGGDGR